MKPGHKKSVYGLIGYPVTHSLSPAMHNAAFASLKIDAEYRLFEVSPEQLKSFLKEDIEVKDVAGNAYSSQRIAGFNITIPHKVRAREILLPGGFGLEANKYKEQDHYVYLSGAINTVKRTEGKFLYRNTDAPGFMRSLKEDLHFESRGKNVLIFGCGGAGRAIIAALTWKSAGAKKIYAYDPNKAAVESARIHFERFRKADSLNAELEFLSQEQISEKIDDSDLLVNASPVGMKEGDGSIIDDGLLHGRLSVYDVVYNRETQLIRDAKSLGLPAADGLGMLLYQGALAFTFWTGEDAPVGVMHRALKEGIRKI
jgi:shikimate dehydrogenase